MPAASARDQRRLVLQVEIHGLSLARATPGTSFLGTRPSIAGVNRLADETSPYLRQHADNPVEWYPWGEAASTRAQEEDKPIFLSIGYASCHWCHVMAHESFEDPATAADLAKWFVSVKVDREERPDLDAVYMAATQALTGSGGWPMSVFCTPDGRPFYAGTYFPPEERHGMPSFRRVVEALGEAWVNERAQVLQQADALADAVRKEMRLAESLQEAGGGSELLVSGEVTPLESEQLQDVVVEGLATGFDPQWGGFGPAPKFPRPTLIELCLLRRLPQGPASRRCTADGGADTRRHGGRGYLRPLGRRILPLLDRRTVVGPALREDAHRSGPPGPGLSPRLAGHGQGRLPRRRQRDVGLRVARPLDPRGRLVLVLRRRCRRRGRCACHLHPRRAGGDAAPTPGRSGGRVVRDHAGGQLGRPLHPGATGRSAPGPAA